MWGDASSLEFDSCDPARKDVISILREEMMMMRMMMMAASSIMCLTCPAVTLVFASLNSLSQHP